MVQLFIDNTEMVLSQNLNIKIKKLSLLVDDEKDNAYNIELPVNRQVIDIFGHINRIDYQFTGGQHKGEILYNNKSILSGNVFVVKFSDDTLTVQIVASQTKLRVSSDNDNRFGGADRLDRILYYQVPKKDIMRSWIDFPYNCDSISIPALYTYDDTCFPVKSSHSNDYYFPNTYNLFSDDSLRIQNVPFPSLYKTIEQVIELNLGYTIRENCLVSNDYARRLFIATFVPFSDGPYSWGDYLPAWSVAKFLVEVEKFFNVFIFFNTKDGYCDIVSRAAKSLVFTSVDVFEEFECDCDETATGSVLMKYNFPDNYYYQLADVNDFTFEWMDKKISNPADAVNNKDFPTKFKVPDKDNWYIYDQDHQDFSHDALLPLNNYKKTGDSESQAKTEFNMIPAIHTCLFYNSIKYVSVPFLDKYDKPEDTAYFSSAELIKANIDEGTSFNNDDKLRIALFAGFADAQPYISVPFTVNKKGASLGYPYGQTRDFNKNLSLESLVQEFGHNTVNLENNVYKFKGVMDFKEVNNSKILIRNKIYILKSITYNLTQDGFDSVVDIEAVPLKE